MKLESVVHMLTLNFRILENIQETTPVIENPMNIPNVPLLNQLHLFHHRLSILQRHTYSY